MEKLGADGHLFTLKKHVEPQTLVACGHAMYHLMRWKPNAEVYSKAGAVAAAASVIANNPHRVCVCLLCAATTTRIALWGLELNSLVCRWMW